MLFSFLLFFFPFVQYIQSDPPTKESLAQTLIQFIQQQEIKLGMGATNRQRIRIPMRCLWDFELGGSLCLIFSIMYRYKTEQRWQNFDFGMESDPSIQLMVDIEKALIEARYLRLPTVFIREDVQRHLRNAIIRILRKYKAQITDQEERATHIIYPQILDPIYERMYESARPLFRRGTHIMMHWYYFPESYDSWVLDENDYLVNMNHSNLISIYL